MSKSAYTLDEAAAEVGLSPKTLRRAQADGALRFHYVTAKPVVLHEDLIAWIEQAPTERKAGAA